MRQRIWLLGRLEIETDEQPSALMKSARGCALLAYLAVTQKTQPRQIVADLLWEASSTAKSLKNLRTLLPYMRRWVLGFDVTRQTVTYTPGPDVFIDLLVLNEAIEQDDVSKLDKALHLYKGSLLDTFYLSDAPRFNEWLLIERENLRQRVILAYYRLCMAYAQQQAWSKGISVAQRWLTLDVLDEEALRHLMQFLAASGQVSVALQQYKHSRQRLWDELAVDPEAATVELAQKLTQLKLEKGEGITWDKIVGVQIEWPLANELAEPGQLPKNAILPYQRNYDFVGRREMLLSLAALLLPKSPLDDLLSRVVAITGMGGMGKTQLAVEFAYRYGRYFPGGVYWLSFAEADNVTAEVSSIGGERGMGLYRDAEKLTLTDQVGRVQRAWQEAIPRLLIFDNCEDEDLLAKWLPKTGGCRVIITSRRGCWTQALGVTIRPLSTLSPSFSITLLKRLAPEVTEVDAADIAAEVGYLPLALQLAGSFLRRYRTMTATHYLSQLRHQGLLDHPSLRGRGSDYSPTGHELDVARTFAINFDYLDITHEVDAMSRQLLVRAACYAPGEPIPRKLLIATVIADEENIDEVLLVEDALVRLVSLGFLEDEGGETVVLHRLLAAFVGKMIDDEAQTAVAQTIHQTIDRYRQQTGSLFFLPVPLSHLRYITHTLLQKGEVIAADLANQLGLHLCFVADYNNVEDYFQKGLSIYEQQYGRNHPDTAVCFTNFGTLHASRGDYYQARLAYEQVLAIREQVLGIHDPQTAIALNNLGYLLIRQGDYEAAHLYLTKAVDLLEEAGEVSSPRLAIFVNNLGLALMYLRNYEEAAALMEQALMIRQETLGIDHPYTAVSLHNLGKLHLEQQKLRQAQTYFEKALTIQKQTVGQNHPHMARSFHMLGCLFIAFNDYPQAQSYLEQALAIQELILTPNHPEKGLTLKDLGDLHQTIGNKKQARLFYERALKILKLAMVPADPYLQKVQSQLENNTVL